MGSQRIGHDQATNTFTDEKLRLREFKQSSCPGGSEVKASACNESGRSPGEGNGNPLQYFCMENPMDGGAWWATVHGVAKSRTRLSDFTSLSLSLAPKRESRLKFKS